MSNYIQSTNFTAKDSLVPGDPNKIIRGSEFDTEFTALSAAISSKADFNNSTLTGDTTAVNLSVSGTFTGTVNGGTY